MHICFKGGKSYAGEVKKKKTEPGAVDDNAMSRVKDYYKKVKRMAKD